jgi:hypothetical protein
MMHRDPALQRYCFQKLSSAVVAVETRERALDVIAFVSAELGIAPPNVIWIQPALPAVTTVALGHIPQLYADHIHPEFARIPDRDDIHGGYTPAWPQIRQVWLRRELGFWALEFAAAHETRHIFQKDKDISIFNDECQAEGDAYPYGYDVLKRYFAGKGRLTPEIEAEIDGKREQARSVFLERWPKGRFEALDYRRLAESGR